MQQQHKHTDHSHQRVNRSFAGLRPVLIAMFMFCAALVNGQVLTNSGANISITTGTYVQGDTVENQSGEIINEGILNLNGNYNNADTTRGNGRYNIAGNWRNTGTFIPDTSTVLLNGPGHQLVYNSGTGYFYKLYIGKPGAYPSSRITLFDDIEVAKTLKMESGIIETGLNKLFLMSLRSNSLIHTSGHIIGKFERGMDSDDNYLFPLGSSENYNPLNLDPNIVPSNGSVLSEFIASDPDTVGLPIPDTANPNIPGVEVYNVIKDGYWSLTADNGFNVGDFNIDVDGSGFSDPNVVQDITRIIKRDNGGDWGIDGLHKPATGTVANRDTLTGNIASTGNHFALGNVRPLIREQPIDTAVCDGTEAFFSVIATGEGVLYYQWQEKGDTGWQDITDGGIYSGATTPTLTISSVNLDMDGYEYRVRISHKYGHVNWSRWAVLTVNPNPQAIAIPKRDTLCNEETTLIALTSDVPGTTFEWEVIYDGSITGASDGTGDTIEQILINPTDEADSVMYRILPTGPLTTYCEGHADTAIVYVNPTPRIVVEVVEDTLCNGQTSTITVTSPTVLTSGEVMYNFTIESVSGNPGDLTGQTEYLGENLGSITQTLDNHSDEYQWVTFRAHPYTVGSTSGTNCNYDDLQDTLISIYVNPTPRIEVTVNEDTICNLETSVISVTSPSILTTGEVVFDVSTENVSGAPGDLTGQIDYNGISLGSVPQTLNNQTADYQWVEFRVHPRTQGDGPGGICDYGQVTDTLFRVYVNPTPDIGLAISNAQLTSDTTFCNNYDVLFDLTNNQQVIGTLRYHLNVTGDIGIVNGETPSTDSLDIIDFTNTLSHGDAAIQQLNYNFMPYIENARGSFGCYNGLDTTVVVKVLPELSAIEEPLVLNPGGFNITCYGLSDGEILLTPEGGDLRYTYTINWEDGTGNPLQSAQADDDFIEGLPAGDYAYDITDTIGCYFESVITLTEPDTLSIMVDSILSQKCTGFEATGAIYVTPEGGVDINDYEWMNLRSGTPAGFGEDLLQATAGSYRYTFSDAFECTFDTSFRIEPAFSLSSQILGQSNYSHYDVECYGMSNAFMEVTGLGGTGPNTYSYRWYDSDMNFISSDSLISNLSAGIYYYYLEDANGCKLGTDVDSIVAVEVTEPDTIRFNMIDDTYQGGWNISCFGAADGIIRFDITGGHYDSIPFTYNWWDFPAGANIVPGAEEQHNLIPGVYKVTVADVNGWCTADTTIVLREPQQIEYIYQLSEYIGGHNVSCFESTDGFIRFDNITGGGPLNVVPKYNVDWMPPEGVTLIDSTVRDLENIPASGPEDYYVFTITDQIGCSVKDSTQLLEPDVLRADTIIDRGQDKNGWAIRCYGFNDGEITLNTEGGTAPYGYNWTGPEGSIVATTEVTDLSAGDYAVIITDENNCEVTYDFALISPDTIKLNPDPDYIECFGETSTISLSPQGGYLIDGNNYQYDWSTGSSEKDLTNVGAGVYYINVTDDNNCVVYDSVVLEQNSLIKPVFSIPSDYNGTDISCFGRSDGQITVSVTGGEPGYQYLWSTGGASNSIRNIPAGDYFVEITDQFNCTVFADTTITEPRGLALSIISDDPSCSYAEDGSIEVLPMYGNPYPLSPSYIYFWEGPVDGLAGTNLDNLPPGDYQLTLSDMNNCMLDTVISLSAPNNIKVEYETTKAECLDAANGSVTITSIDGGTPPFIVNDEFEQYYFDKLSVGAFELVVRDNNQCEWNDTIIIDPSRLSCLDIPNAFTPNEGDNVNNLWILDEDEDGSNDMYLYPNAVLRIFNRWGELVYMTTDVANEPWDGTYKGRDMPIDTYHYILDLGNGDPPIRGNVTIIR